MIPAIPIEPKSKLPVVPLAIGAAYTNEFEVCADPDIDVTQIMDRLYEQFRAFEEQDYCAARVKKLNVCRHGRVHWMVSRI